MHQKISPRCVSSWLCVLLLVAFAPVAGAEGDDCQYCHDFLDIGEYWNPNLV